MNMEYFSAKIKVAFPKGRAITFRLSGGINETASKS